MSVRGVVADVGAGGFLVYPGVREKDARAAGSGGGSTAASVAGWVVVYPGVREEGRRGVMNCGRYGGERTGARSRCERWAGVLKERGLGGLAALDVCRGSAGCGEWCSPAPPLVTPCLPTFRLSGFSTCWKVGELAGAVLVGAAGWVQGGMNWNDTGGSVGAGKRGERGAGGFCSEKGGGGLVFWFTGRGKRKADAEAKIQMRARSGRAPGG